MKIDHVAIWVKDLEKMKDFYISVFDMKCNTKYINPVKKFSSYFLSFDNGARIELMHKDDIDGENNRSTSYGITHLAISVGCKTKVDNLTNSIKEMGYKIVGEPRTTGDGYYESVILDPEGNQIEITE